MRPSAFDFKSIYLRTLAMRFIHGKEEDWVSAKCETTI